MSVKTGQDFILNQISKTITPITKTVAEISNEAESTYIIEEIYQNKLLADTITVIYNKATGESVVGKYKYNPKTFTITFIDTIGKDYITATVKFKIGNLETTILKATEFTENVEFDEIDTTYIGASTKLTQLGVKNVALSLKTIYENEYFIRIINKKEDSFVVKYKIDGEEEFTTYKCNIKKMTRSIESGGTISYDIELNILE